MENIEILKEQLPQLTINELCNIILRLYEGENINCVLDEYVVNLSNSSNDAHKSGDLYHCQREEEEESKCETQCEHCKEYYKGTDNGR
jgi:hypothetical protein